MSGEDLKAFVDGELPPWRHWWVARRVARDPALQAEVVELRKLSEDLAALELPEAPLSDSLRARLLTAAESLEGNPMPVARRSPAKLVALGLVGASLLAVGVVVLNPGVRQSEEAPTAAAPAAPAAFGAMKSEADAKSSVMAAPMPDLNSNGASAAVTDSASRERHALNVLADKQNAGLQFERGKAAGSAAAYQPQARGGGRVAAAPKGVEVKEVVELVAGPDSESLMALRKRVEEKVVESGGRVLKQEPFQVVLPEALRATARQKLTALVTAQPEKERKRSNAALAETGVEQRLKVTVYFED